MKNPLRFVAIAIMTFGFATAASAEKDTSPESVSDIHKNVKDLIGKTVTLRGEIDDIEGLHAFEFESDDDSFFHDVFGRDRDEILVISRRPLSEMLADPAWSEDANVSMTGQVQTFSSAADAEKQLGIQLGPEAHREWKKSEAVLILESIVE